MPTRFYCPNPPNDGVYRLSADEARHLRRVCRLGAGDETEIFDGRGFASCARVIGLGSDWADLTAIGEPIPEREPPLPLVLASAAPKADRLDWLVEKATELGVARLIPLVSDRSVVEPGSSKIARLQCTVIEASKQCGRARLMAIDPPARWSNVVHSFPDFSRFLADADGVSLTLVPRFRRDMPWFLQWAPRAGSRRRNARRRQAQGGIGSVWE